MNQRKPNNSLWYSLGLAVLLCVAFLVVSTGTTLARYRAEREKEIKFQVGVPEQICLGVVRTITEEEATDDLLEGTVIFDPEAKPEWGNLESTPQLTFAAANGVSETEYSQGDQRIRLRLIGTLGLWTGTETAAIYLHLPAEDGSNKVTKVQATVTQIVKDTALYHTHGDGWIYTFRDANGEELSWILPGGKLSYISMTITMEGSAPSSPSLLKPQIIAETIGE